MEKAKKQKNHMLQLEASIFLTVIMVQFIVSTNGKFENVNE